MEAPQRMVVALGGNALCPAGMAGNIAEQFAQSRRTAQCLADLADRGHHLLITHGNGPQVGNILRRVEIASKEVYPIDLGLCVADTQAGMGYMICQCLFNEFRKRGQQRLVSTIVTSVLVDRDDAAFSNPTKPIGPYFTKNEAQRHIDKDGWQITEVPGQGFRRVVPSPKPQRIVQIELIRRLFDTGELLVACGGGGIPIVDTPGWGYEGVEAVIDKDLSAALLARGIEADVLAILTDQPCVYVDFGKPNQKGLDRLTVSDAKRLQDAGQFPPGSMGPKIEAAINFVEQSSKPGTRTLIASCDTVVEALDGRAGTWIVSEAS